MDIIALLMFLGVIIIAFIKKINVGVLALAVGVIAVRVFGLNDKVLIGAISSSMLATLVGITLLLSLIHISRNLSL